MIWGLENGVHSQKGNDKQREQGQGSFEIAQEGEERVKGQRWVMEVVLD